MNTKRTALICITMTLFASCTKEVNTPPAPVNKLSQGAAMEVTTASQSATASQGVITSRVIIRDFTYTTQEPCSGQLVQMTGTKRITSSYNPNTGLVKVNIFLNARGTLDDGELFNIHANQFVEVPVGATATFRQVSHYQTNHHGGTVNVNEKGIMVTPNEFQETFLQIEINCG